MNVETTGSGDSDRRAKLIRNLPAEHYGSSVGGTDLWELAAVIWQGKWIVAAVTATFAIVSVVIALWLPNEYKATVLLMPSSASSTSALTRLAGQFGGLASLAGVDLDSDSTSDKSVVAMELVRTWDFLEQFVRDNEIEVEVFAAQGWNRASDQIVIDSDVYDAAGKSWTRKFDPAKGEAAEPSGWELYKALRDRVSIRQDKKTKLITLSVEHYSPKIAKDWADKLVGAINTRLKEQDRADAKRSIEYLKKQVEATSLSEMQMVFYRLIEEQTKNLMLTEVDDEYVLKTVSAAKTPEEKSKPHRATMCIMGTLVGGILSVLGLVLRYHWTSSPSKER